MKHFLSILIFLGGSTLLPGQNLPANRLTNWELAGLQEELPDSLAVYNILAFGGDNSGSTSNHPAFVKALLKINNRPAKLYFPSGEYLFTEGIILPENLELYGDGETSKLMFDLSGRADDAITISGKTLSIHKSKLHKDLRRGQNRLHLKDPSGLATGDWIYLQDMSENHTSSSWAKGSIGQLFQIQKAGNGPIELRGESRYDFSNEYDIVVTKIAPIQRVAIKCLSIERRDQTGSQTSTISLNYAANIRLQNLHLKNANFAHIELNQSAHNLIKGCFFEEAHHYGNGGKAYGVVLQFSSGDNLVYDNIFRKLRHSILFQAGANGNVVAYNYSREPYWTEVSLPSHSAGDIVFHGNYPFLNLVEGNIVQNIVLDDSHGQNGPFNTFFKNQVEGYGFFINPEPAADSVNAIGVECTNPSFLKGLFVSKYGKGHFLFANKSKGKMIPKTSGKIERHSYFLDLSDFSGGEIGELDALERYRSGQYLSCSPWRIKPKNQRDTLESGLSDTSMMREQSVGKSETAIPTVKLYPNPGKSVLRIETTENPFIRIIRSDGKLIAQGRRKQFDLSGQNRGIYHIVIEGENYRISKNWLLVN